jgi:hypothetical protein
VDAAKTGKSGLNPFQLLSSALDLLVEGGVLPRERRPGAEYLAWSAVHGLAILIIEGPLNSASDKEIRAMSERVLLLAPDRNVTPLPDRNVRLPCQDRLWPGRRTFWDG